MEYFIEKVEISVIKYQSLHNFTKLSKMRSIKSEDTWKIGKLL